MRFKKILIKENSLNLNHNRMTTFIHINKLAAMLASLLHL